MQLALFTPSAALWPVLRNFDVFIASLGTPRADADAISGSALYPLQSQDAVLPKELELRLDALHRELYSALLRPSETFAGDVRSIAEAFWPDLHGTSVDALLEAFFYYFVHRVSGDVSVSDGLSVFRAVFFNHAATDPSLWIYAAEQRLNDLRFEFPVCKVEIGAPASTRWKDLNFVANSSTSAAPAGPSWLWGTLRRRPDGYVYASVECGADLSMVGSAREPQARELMGRELRTTVETIFGWQSLEATA